MSKKTGQTPEYLNPKHVSHRAHQERVNRYVRLGTFSVLGIVVAILLFGALYQNVWKPNRVVASVDDTRITLGDYQSLYRYRAVTLWDQISTLNQQRDYVEGQEDLAFLVSTYEQQIASAQTQLQSLPTSVLNELLDYAIARREADSRGLVVTEDEVQLEVESLFGYDRDAPIADTAPVTVTEPITAAPVPTEPPMTEQEFLEMSENYYTQVQEATDFTKENLYDLVEGSLYMQAISDVIADEVTTTAEQAYFWRMAFETLEEAELAYDEVLGGADFEGVAQARQDELEMSVNAEIGWIPRGQMSEALDNAAFALSVDQISTPVETINGWELVKMTDYDASRELDEYSLGLLQNQAVEDWFYAQRQSEDVVSNWTSDMIPEL